MCNSHEFMIIWQWTKWHATTVSKIFNSTVSAHCCQNHKVPWQQGLAEPQNQGWTSSYVVGGGDTPCILWHFVCRVQQLTFFFSCFLLLYPHILWTHHGNVCSFNPLAVFLCESACCVNIYLNFDWTTLPFPSFQTFWRNVLTVYLRERKAQRHSEKMEEGFPFIYPFSDFVLNMAGLALFFTDLALDIWAVVNFYQDEAYVAMGVLIFLLVGSSVLLHIFSWLWYNYEDETGDLSKYIYLEKYFRNRRLLGVLHVFQLGVIFRLVTVLWNYCTSHLVSVTMDSVGGLAKRRFICIGFRQVISSKVHTS